ncbi:Protein of unknown function [Bacillus mycoides]|nr:Protein of unknown function [Bacillus mycoides]
MESVTENEG